MTNVLEIGTVVLASFVIVLGLLQKGTSDGLSSAFTGSKDLTLFAVQKERGFDKLLTILMSLVSLGLIGCLLGLQFV